MDFTGAERAGGGRVKNWEKYASEIKRLGLFNIAVLKDTGEVIPCRAFPHGYDEINYSHCNMCRFQQTDCNRGLTEWAYEEAEEEKKTEPPKLTPEEHIFIKNFYGGYMARDIDGELFIYDSEPEREGDMWEASPIGGYYNIKKELFKDVVKWEDEEPWRVEDLQKLEVKPATRAENKTAESEEV